ncbi:bis(5'-nucleosyl)-tetraphosphatase [Sphingomonas sp. DBB INV C78]|uniref:metallophosphoesterase family protein n=1 Tax=Sphingomonas sp. DBB INV C78 TaxID=3349434 RepID=UPI0036D359A5
MVSRIADHPLLRPAAKADPATRGRSVEGQLVYAIGDIHGSYQPLKALLQRVVPDATARAHGRCPILIFCGDYVDRGPQSSDVLDALVWLKRRPNFEIHLLKGNHEQALLAFLEDPEDAEGWLEFGGVATLRSYGVEPPDPRLGPDDCYRARDQFLDAMPAAHLRLLERLELMIGIGDYAFVHAGVRPSRPLDQQHEDDLLWIRREFLDATAPSHKTIVHGHSWHSDQPEILPHRIGIDTGAYETGILTALRLEDGQVETIQSR